jgi:hypothetical protein
MVNLSSFTKGFRKTQNNAKAIILGTDYPEYKLYKVLKSKGDKVPFFISEDPWKYNTPMEEAVCRYPNELTSLCKNHHINFVYYCDPIWLEKIPNLPEQTRLIQG